MRFEAWMFAAMEERGYMDTNTSIINRVAYYLAELPGDEISLEQFRNACIECDVNPDSFSKDDFLILQAKLDEIT